MERQTIPIRSESIRLDAFLKFTGCVVTGGHAKIVIQDGEVAVNGKICTLRGKKLRPGDTVDYGQNSWTVAAIESQ